jgi:hypothetical protein
VVEDTGEEAPPGSSDSGYESAHGGLDGGLDGGLPRDAPGFNPPDPLNQEYPTEAYPSITTSTGMTYARKHAQDLTAIEASFQLAEIKSLRDNQ